MPIVEGFGDVEAVPALLSRVYEFVGGPGFIVPLTPIRVPRQRLVRATELGRAVRLAGLRLAFIRDPEAARLVLVLLDADEDAACLLAPRLLTDARSAVPGMDIVCVLAVTEYETWFAASADSLSEFLDMTAAEPPSTNPEGSRHGKRWVERRFRAPKYSETLDQRRMTAAMDLAACRRCSPSFDKLCREIEVRVRPR